MQEELEVEKKDECIYSDEELDARRDALYAQEILLEDETYRVEPNIPGIRIVLVSGQGQKECLTWKEAHRSVFCRAIMEEHRETSELEIPVPMLTDETLGRIATFLRYYATLEARFPKLSPTFTNKGIVEKSWEEGFLTPLTDAQLADVFQGASALDIIQLRALCAAKVAQRMTEDLPQNGKEFDSLAFCARWGLTPLSDKLQQTLQAENDLLLPCLY